MGFPERIKQIRKHLGMNQSEFATKLKVSRSVVSEFENGTREPSKDFLLSLHDIGVSIDWFLSGQGVLEVESKLINKPFAMSFLPSKNGGGGVPIIREQVPDGLIIPFLDQPVSAGPGKVLEDEGAPERFITVPRELSRYQNLNALPVRGDSMSPTLHEGDLVVCDSCGWDGDGVYVIRGSDSAYVKRVVQTSKGYTVISDNKAYPAYSESKDDIMIVGKVRCAVVQIK